MTKTVKLCTATVWMPEKSGGLLSHLVRERTYFFSWKDTWWLPAVLSGPTNCRLSVCSVHAPRDSGHVTNWRQPKTAGFVLLAAGSRQDKEKHTFSTPRLDLFLAWEKLSQAAARRKHNATWFNPFWMFKIHACPHPPPPFPRPPHYDKLRKTTNQRRLTTDQQRLNMNKQIQTKHQ